MDGAVSSRGQGHRWRGYGDRRDPRIWLPRQAVLCGKQRWKHQDRLLRRSDVGLPTRKSIFCASTWTPQRSGCEALPGSVAVAVMTVLRGCPNPAGGAGLVSFALRQHHPVQHRPWPPAEGARESRAAPPRDRLERWVPEPAPWLVFYWSSQHLADLRTSLWRRRMEAPASSRRVQSPVSYPRHLQHLRWRFGNVYEKEMATHSSILAWRIAGTEEPSGLPFVGSHRVRHDWSDLAVAAAACSYFS